MKSLKVYIVIFVLATVFIVGYLKQIRVFADTPIQYFKSIVVTVNDAIPSDYTVSLSFDHQSLVSSGKSLVNGNDIRVFYDPSGLFLGGEAELDRVLDEKSNWNQTDTKIWFKLNSGILSSTIDSSRYRLYYGNSYAPTPPQNKINVYYFWDDFEDNSLTGWIIESGSWNETGGVMRWGPIDGRLISSINHPSDFFAEFKVSQTNNDGYLAILADFVDANNFYGFGYDPRYGGGSWSLVKIASGIVDFQSRNFSPEFRPSANTRISLKIINGTFTGYVNDSFVSSFKWGSSIAEHKIGLFGAGGGPNIDFDNFLVRKAVENEPIVTLGEELTPSPTPTPTFTPTPTLTPTPTPSPSPTVTPTPTLTPTPTPIDTTPPRIQKAETIDSDKDGRIDGLHLTFSENILDSSFVKDTASGFDVKDYEQEKLESGEGSNDNLLLLKFSEKEKPDTNSEPKVGYHNGSITDLAGNKLMSFDIKSIDKAPPVLLSAKTRDNNNNGKIDKLTVNFSEILNNSSVSKDDFNISLPNSNYTINFLKTAGKVVTLSLWESSYFDTGAKPTVTVKASSIKDKHNNGNEEKSLVAQDLAVPYLIVKADVEKKTTGRSIVVSGIASDFSPNEDSIVTHIIIFGKKLGERKWQELAVLNNDEIIEPFIFGPFEWKLITSGKYSIRVVAEDLAGNINTINKSNKLN